MSLARLLAFALSLTLLCACESYSLDDLDSASGTSSSGASSSSLEPTSHGLGTQQSPLTPDDMLEGIAPESSTECWVMGYVVGSTYRSMSNAVFGTPTSYTSNILLACDSLCRDASQCIAAELTKTSAQNSFSLCLHPEGVRQFVVLRGTYGAYFSRAGIRAVSEGYWLPGFDLAGIPSASQGWGDIWEWQP